MSGRQGVARVSAIGYNPSLDGLRAVAVLAVLAIHTQVRAAGGGGVGVDVFFVLSGFLITTLLLEERQTYGSVGLRSFYARRALRLLPALVAVLIASAILAITVYTPAMRRWTFFGILAAATYSSAWFAGEGRSLGVLGPTWSLSIEEWFYILWPASFLALLRRVDVRTLARRATILSAIFGVVRIFLGRYYLFRLGTTRTALLTIDRLDGLTIGCCLALWVAAGIRPKTDTQIANTRRAALAASALAAVFVGVLPWMKTDTGTILMSGGAIFMDLATAVVLFQLVTCPGGWLANSLSSRWMTWLGRRSYGLYLWHVPIFIAIPPLPAHLGTPVRVGASIVACWLSYRFIESPFLRMKDRFARRTGGIAVEPEHAAPAG